MNTSTSNELTLVNPGELYRQASDVAGVCGAIVKQTAVSIQGKKYVKAEGWLSIAAAHGCIASARDVEHVEGGIRAIGELRRLDGTIISTAEGFVGDDEPKWANGPEYARRAMAQTRAVSRVCRSAFAHVVVLIDAGLSTTPAEEVPDNGFGHPTPTLEEQRQTARERISNGNGHTREIKPLSAFQSARKAMQAPQQPEDESQLPDWRNAVCTFGKTGGPLRGHQLGELSDRNLDYLTERFVDTDQPIDAKDQQMADALMIRRQQLQGAAAQMKQAVSKPAQMLAENAAATDSDEVPF